MLWLSWVFAVLTALLLGFIVSLLISVVRTTYRIDLRPGHMEAEILTKTTLTTFKFYALKVVDMEEISLEITFLGRLFVFRLEYPRISMRMKGKYPSLYVKRQVEVGSGSADPLKEGEEEITVASVLRIYYRTQTILNLLSPHLARLKNNTTIQDPRLNIRQSTGDPASTAVAHGLLCALVYGVAGWACGKMRISDPPRIVVEPIFGKPYADLRASGDVRVGLFFLLLFGARSLRSLWPMVGSLIKPLHRKDKGHGGMAAEGATT